MPPEFFWLAGITFLAGLVHGLTGFGIMLVSLPLMALVLDIRTAVPLILLLALVVNSVLVVQLRKHIETAKWLPFFLAALPGIPLGVRILRTVTQQHLELLTGVVVLATVLFIWRHPVRSGRNAISRRWVLAAGFCAGFLGGSIGVSGPPVIVCTALQPWTRHQVKATLVVFFIIVSSVTVAYDSYIGLVTREVLWGFGCCLPALAAGILAGVALFSRIGDAGYRHLIHLLLLILGLMMLIRGGTG